MTRSAFSIIALTLLLLGASAHAEPYEYTGSLELSFPSAMTSMKFSIPLSGTAERSPTPPFGFALLGTRAFTVTHSITGAAIPNPLPLVTGSLTSFNSVFLGDLVLYPGTVGMTGGGVSGLDVDIGSLELLGTTVNLDFVTASLNLVSIAPAPLPAPGKLVIFNDSTAVSQPITAEATGWSLATSNLDASGGTLSLVTPIAITTAHALSSPIEANARLQLTFVPEPGVGWMLGTGSLLLAEAGRRRRRQMRA